MAKVARIRRFEDVAVPMGSLRASWVRFLMLGRLEVLKIVILVPVILNLVAFLAPQEV